MPLGCLYQYHGLSVLMQTNNGRKMQLPADKVKVIFFLERKACRLEEGGLNKNNDKGGLNTAINPHLPIHL